MCLSLLLGWPVYSRGFEVCLIQGISDSSGFGYSRLGFGVDSLWGAFAVSRFHGFEGV